jgi:hypothetical protein
MWEEKTRPVVVKTLQDIRIALQPFTESNEDSVPLSCEMQWQEDNKTKKAKVTGKSTSSSHGDVLSEGMSVVKKRMDAIGQLRNSVNAAKEEHKDINMEVWDVDKITFGIDSVIKRRLGGVRKGCRIRWTVREGTFEYDPFQRKLYEVDSDDV